MKVICPTCCGEVGEFFNPEGADCGCIGVICPRCKQELLIPAGPKRKKIPKQIILYPWVQDFSGDVVQGICKVFSEIKSGTFKVENAGDPCEGKVIITEE